MKKSSQHFLIKKFKNKPQKLKKTPQMMKPSDYARSISSKIYSNKT